MQPIRLTTLELAQRWKTTDAALRQWRWNGKGPKFLKMGRRVSYRLEDVEAFENQHYYASTSSPSLNFPEQKKRD